MLQAEQKSVAAEAEIADGKNCIAALKAEAAELQRQYRARKLQMVQASSWSSPALIAKYSQAP